MDVGGWDGRPGSPSWSATGLESVAALVDGDQDDTRAREPGERVMVCYRSGLMLPATVAIVRPGEGTTVIADDLWTGRRSGLVGLFAPRLLRTIVHTQCVPAELVAELVPDAYRLIQ